MILPKSLEELTGEEIKRKQYFGKITTHVLNFLTRKFLKEDFNWLLPVIFSKSTDPLWPDPEASIEKRIDTEIYGEKVMTTSSMIVHKMVACSLIHKKLFILSPNIRIENRNRATSGVHSYEFTQLDFEARDKSSADMRGLIEDTVCELISNLKLKIKDELCYLGRFESLKTPKKPFDVYDLTNLKNEYGEDWEANLPFDSETPIWVTNIPREFYDFEDFRDKYWDNYDLMIPKYGELSSGSRREVQYDKIISKMNRESVKKENFKVLLEMAKDGHLKPSAGAGIGVERLIRWIAGVKHIGDVQLFPKIPGNVYAL